MPFNLKMTVTFFHSDEPSVLQLHVSLSSDLHLAKGKGNKLINIPAKRLKSGEEKLAATLAITPEDSFLVHAGARYIRFKWKDLVNYVGSRAKRGLMLPQGFRNVDRVELEND